MNSFDDSTYMSADPLIMFQDGSDAVDFLNYDTKKLTQLGACLLLSTQDNQNVFEIVFEFIFKFGFFYDFTKW